MNEGTLRKAIYDWIAGMVAPGTTVIWNMPDEQRPAKPYIAMDIISGPRVIGQDEERMLGPGQDTMTVVGWREITLSVNFYGTKALEGLGSIQSRLRWPSTRESLYKDGLVFVSDSGVRDLTQLLETRTETRAQVDLVLRYSVNVEDLGATGAIDIVELKNEIDDPATSTFIPEAP